MKHDVSVTSTSNIRSLLTIRITTNRGGIVYDLFTNTD